LSIRPSNPNGELSDLSTEPDEARRLVDNPSFPRSSGYDPDWVAQNRARRPKDRGRSGATVVELIESHGKMGAMSSGVEAGIARIGGISYLRIPARDPRQSATFYGSPD
jgi:hypothetical protein